MFVFAVCCFLLSFPPSIRARLFVDLGGHALCLDSGPSLKLGVSEGVVTLFFVFL